jgi:hypothetical protein
MFLLPYTPTSIPLRTPCDHRSNTPQWWRLNIPQVLRARAEQMIDAFWDAVRAMIRRFTPTECVNNFRASGYEPDKTGSVLNRSR